jgi:hypothetical protein
MLSPLPCTVTSTNCPPDSCTPISRFLIRLAFGTGRFGGLQGLVYVFDPKAKVIDAFAPAMSRM